jgi:3',5'-cyclic AMP phosphodiesterase CpdA
MSLSRREFIKNISAASLVLMGGNVLSLTSAQAESLKKKSILRFVVASDGHYGQTGTEFDLNYTTIVKNITTFHDQSPIDFCVINGDIIHDGKDFLSPAKKLLDALPVKYYVTRGNHDNVSGEYWNEVFGMPLNHDVVMRKNVILLADTSNEKGEFLSPDLVWLKAKLDAYKNKKNVFLFLHIPQAMWTKWAVDTPAFFELVKSYKNIRGVFHGHEHEEDGVRMVEHIPYMFDSHFGGNWGTAYKGFRVVELMKDQSLLTYIMNPTERINQATF